MALYSTEVLENAVILRKYPVMFIKDCPQANEIITQGTKVTPSVSRKFKGGAFTSLTAKKEFEILQSLGITRFNLHPTYMFNFRPPDGEISSLFWKKGTDATGYVSYGDEKNIFMLDYAYNELLRVRDEISAAQPKLIIASGKWALYFLTRTPKFSETVKSPYGTLLKWRASHMRLHPFFGMEDVLVLPILPLDSSMSLPDKEYLSKIDAKRIRRLAHVAMSEPEKMPAELVPDEQFYIQPPAEEDYIDREHFIEQRDIFYQTVLSLLDSLLATCDKLPDGLKLSTDVETQAYRFIDCIGLAWAKNAGICIPFSSKRSVNYWELEQEIVIHAKLRALFLHEKCKHIGQNYQYDMQYYDDNLLMKILPEWDTMIGIHSMFSVMEKKLSLLSSVFCSYHYNWKENFNYEKGAKPSERWLYNIRDCCRTYEISEKQREMYAHADPSRIKVLNAQLYEVLPDVMKIMDAGLELDTALRDYTVRELEQRAAQLEKDILYVLGEEVCLASPKQMQRVFYTLFDCPKQYKTSVNSEGEQVVGLTVDEGALVQFYITETLLRPLLDMMLDHRRLVKTATNIKSLTVSPFDGKLRCTLSVTGTDTYRFSSTSTALGYGTNLQTLSKGKYLRSGEKLPNTKKLIRIPAGRIGFDIDLDSADLRYVTARSGAKGLQAMFDAGKKPYVELMKEYYHDPTKTKDDREYTIFKGICHGCVTGDHQVLTKTGWIDIKDLSSEESIMVWDNKKNSLFFEVPTGLNKDFVNASEPLLYFSGAAFSQIVTLDHTMPYTTTDRYTGKFCKAAKLPPSARLPYSSQYVGGNLNLPDDQVMLITALQADGTVNYIGKDTCSYRFHFRRLRKVDRLLAILHNLGIDYSYKTLIVTTENSTVLDHYIEFKDNFYLKPDLKYPGEWLLDLSESNLKLWLEESILWDGHERTSNGVRKSLSTTRKETAVWFQTIAQMCGYGSKIITKTRDITRKVLYEISLNSRNFHSIPSGEVQYFKHSGITVYCPKTSTGFWLVRHNGHISLTGNTNYVGSAAGIAANVGLLVHEVERVQKWYFGANPEIPAWHKWLSARIFRSNDKWIENVFGYRRYFFNLRENNLMQIAAAWEPQSSVAILINKGMHRIFQELPDVTIRMQTHDSLFGDYPDNMAYLADEIKRCCSVELPFDRPIVIPVDLNTSTTTWGDIA